MNDQAIIAILSLGAGEPPDSFVGPEEPLPAWPDYTTLHEELRGMDSRENLINVYLEFKLAGPNAEAEQVFEFENLLNRYQVSVQEIEAAILYEEAYAATRIARAMVAANNVALRRAAWALHYAQTLYVGISTGKVEVQG